MLKNKTFMNEKYYKELEEIIRDLKVDSTVTSKIHMNTKKIEETTKMQRHREILKKENAELHNKIVLIEQEYNEYLENIKREHEEQIKTIYEETHYLQQEALRARTNEKKLRNEILNLKGNCRVYCRIRPNKTNSTSNNANKITYSENKLKINENSFEVDRIFGVNAQQREIFDEMELFVENVLDGYKLCIFAYGQTGSGKTYTMEGNKDGLIYKSIKKLKDALENTKVTYTVKFLEIYNESMYDLCTQEKVVVQQEESQVKIKNVTEIITSDLDEILGKMEEIGKFRRTAETKCNEKSSRSHFVFMINLEMHLDGEIRKGSLCLIDLAGSERVSNSKVTDQRLKETQNINKSLSALGNVFTAIKRGDAHVPFRDSKLTHLMKEHLTVNSRTVMMVNVNLESMDETICSMRFATKVSECVLRKATKNVEYY